MTTAAATTSPRYGIAARFYDLAYGKLAPVDVPFYLELAALADGPVLELGCGTGRVGLELARAGFNVEGLDLSAEMLAVYLEKLAAEPADIRERVELHEGNMADFDLGRRFALIIVPFRAFLHLLTPEDQRACLLLVRRHLADGGRFVFDAFNPDLLYIADAVQRGRTWRNDVIAPDGEGGTLMRSMYANPDPGRQLHELMLRYEQLDASGQLVGTWVEGLPLRWLYRWEAQYLLELCGLEVVEAYGDYQRTPFDESKSRSIVFVCRGV